MVDWLTQRDIRGATVLEVGGGVGALQLELLRRGASRATNVELVDYYDADAFDLAREAGLADRVLRRRLDLAADPDTVDPHDIVVLHRVVCCYPDYRVRWWRPTTSIGRPPPPARSRASTARPSRDGPPRRRDG
jgi:hypothetical protein